MNKHPWRRFWARAFDYLIPLTILSLLLDLAAPPWRGDYLLHFLWVSALAILLWVPIEAWAIHKYGRTPGKALLGIRVVGHNGHRPTSAESWKRACGVWLRGMGAGIWGVGQITQLVAAFRLRSTGQTSWDRTTQPVFGPLQPLRTVFFIALFLLVEGFLIGFSSHFVRGLLLMQEIDLKY